MPSAYAPIPLPGRGASDSSRTAFQPAFAAPVRWTLLVLSWLAFFVAGYLAFHSVSGTSVAGCGGSGNGCDVVLTSAWSKWISIPVAVLGLGCYATLASLSVLFWWRDEEASRWVTTFFVMLAVVAAGASMWFIGVQIFAIQDYCKFCLVADTCGILIGVISIIAAVQSVVSQRKAPPSPALQSAIMGIRPATPAGARPAILTFRITGSPPSLGIALGGAVPLLALLVVGQTLFAAKTYEVQKVALTDAIDLTGSNETKAGDAATKETPGEKPEIPAEADAGDKKGTATESIAADSAKGNGEKSAGGKTATDSPPTASEPTRERLVKFLGGKLTLNVYQHPLIGSPEAPHIAIEMVSYDCPHCRKMHAIVSEALARYGDQVALLVMPIPLDKDCNKMITDPAVSHPEACGTARYAVGIAKFDPPAFVKFHDFLMTGKDKPPAMERIVPKAYGLVDRVKLRDFAQGGQAKKQIDGYVDLFIQLQKTSGNKNFGLPVQILGDNIVTGEVAKSEDVFKTWEENLGVKPK